MIVGDVKRLLHEASRQPVHANLWPGVLLKQQDGFEVIDFRLSGEGPCAVVSSIVILSGATVSKNSSVPQSAFTAGSQTPNNDPRSPIDT